MVMLNDALKDYYENLALEAVLCFAGEQNVRLRRGDFWLFDNQQDRQNFLNFRGEYSGKEKKGRGFWDYYNSNRVEGVFTEKNGTVTGVVYVYLYHSKGRVASRLKDKTRNFLNYRYAIVDKEKIVFSFTLHDLDIITAQNDRGGETSEGGFSREKVIDKINKLLSKTVENNATEEEALSASMLVQKLLAKYHLSMADVRGESDQEEITQVTARVDKGNKWKYGLAKAVADGYACKCYYVGNESIVFYGYETDVIAARRVFTYLFSVGNRLARQYVKERKEKGAYDVSGVANAFLSGFTDGIRGEFEKQCTALALVVQPEVEESYKEFSADFKLQDCSLNLSKMDWTAYGEGTVEGKRALRGQYLTGETEGEGGKR